MTISNPTSVAGPFTPDGVTTTFPFTFAAMSPTELQPVQIQGGIAVPLSGWTATLSGEGGSVVFAIAPAAGSGALYIEGDPDFTQGVTADVAVLPGVLAKSLDRSTAQALALKGKSDRAVIAPPGEAGVALPASATRAGRVLAFNSDGSVNTLDPGFVTGKANFDLQNVSTASRTATTVPQVANAFNPTDRGARANDLHFVTAPAGTRALIYTAQAIQVTDPGSGTASGQGYAGAALLLQASKANYPSISATAGEIDPLMISLRNVNGDGDGIAINVTGQNGNFAGVEGNTSIHAAGNPGNVLKQVGYQLGIVNDRDGGESGLSVIASIGTIGTGVLAQSYAGASFTFPFAHSVSTGQLWAQDSAGFSRYFKPGVPGTQFQQGYVTGNDTLAVRDGSGNILTALTQAGAFATAAGITSGGPLTLKNYTVGTVPSAAAFASSIIYVTNMAPSGGPAFSDGANWRRCDDSTVIHT